MKHTPGPWRVEPLQADHGASLAIVGERKGEPLVIAQITPLNEDDEPDYDDAERDPDDEGNAHLLAAAPELLDIVKLLVGALATNYTAETINYELGDKARELIARIKGEDVLK